MVDLSNEFKTQPIVRKNMVMFYMIDTSGSMSGSKINAVNNAMTEVVEKLADVGGADSDIKIAVMTFDDDVNWIYPEPISVEQFDQWIPLTTNCCTSMGAAFSELNRKMSRSAYLQSATQSYAPIVFLLSDGEPTDDYLRGLNELKKNKWYKYCTKVAMAIGDDANIDILTEFTGNKELVVKANNGDALIKLIKFVSITSSQIGSRSQTIDPDNGTINDDTAIKQRETDVIDVINNIKDPSDLDNDDSW